MRILAFVDYFLPGFKSGGPVRTLAGMIERLEPRHAFSVVTRDRDQGDAAPYGGIRPGAWTRVGHAEVMYLSPEMRSMGDFRRVLSSSSHDVVYFNSLYSPTFTLKPLLLLRTGRVPRMPVVVAPRGECAAAAVSIKRAKKRLFLEVARRTGYYRNVTFQASSPAEERDIRRWFGASARIVVAPNLVSLEAASAPRARDGSKVAGHLRLVFLSRIARMKNLRFALEALRDVEGDVELDIFGPMEDPAYWRECERAARGLPPGVVVRYRGEALRDDVPRIFAEHDFLLHPSRGENFGHVISEALLSGCPVIVSDRTPWRGLEGLQAGWDLPLEDPPRFRDVLRRCVAMDAETHARLSTGARACGLARSLDDAALEANVRLFDVAARGKK